MSAAHQEPSKKPNVQSDNLMRIVAVVYGVALTQALINRTSVIQDPLAPENIIPVLSLACVALLSCYAYFAYVMAVSTDHSYTVEWTKTALNWKGSLRFATDLGLSVLYVWLLFVTIRSTDPSTHLETAPDLRPVWFAILVVMVGAAFVRIVRYKSAYPALPSLSLGLASLVLWRVQGDAPTRGRDVVALLIALLFVFAYIPFNEWLGYQFWKKHPPTAA